MREKNWKQLIRLASRCDGPLSTITATSIRGGAMQFEMLERKLTEAGYTWAFNDGEHISRVQVLHGEAGCVAAGTSGDRDDALLHAMLGAVREEVARKAIREACAANSVEIDAKLASAMESRFIEAENEADGAGAVYLAKQMAAFPAKP